MSSSGNANNATDTDPSLSPATVKNKILAPIKDFKFNFVGVTHRLRRGKFQSRIYKHNKEYNLGQSSTWSFVEFKPSCCVSSPQLKLHAYPHIYCPLIVQTTPSKGLYELGKLCLRFVPLYHQHNQHCINLTLLLLLLHLLFHSLQPQTQHSPMMRPTACSISSLPIMTQPLNQKAGIPSQPSLKEHPTSSIG